MPRVFTGWVFVLKLGLATKSIGEPGLVRTGLDHGAGAVMVLVATSASFFGGLGEMEDAGAGLLNCKNLGRREFA